jgi:hypothetical protein
MQLDKLTQIHQCGIENPNQSKWLEITKLIAISKEKLHEKCVHKWKTPPEVLKPMRRHRAWKRRMSPTALKIGSRHFSVVSMLGFEECRRQTLCRSCSEKIAAKKFAFQFPPSQTGL